MATTLLIGLLPLLAAANPLRQLAARECQHNNCVRAVIASAVPSRSGSADCVSYLKTTVTPATVTVTATLTFSEVAGTTRPVTDHETVAITKTQTSLETATETGPTITVTVPTGLGISRRQVTVAPTVTPAYASVCSDAARYASACSCAYGIVPTVITVQAPVTTITVSNTVTISTKTNLETVATETATLTSSATVTVVDATVTITPTATAYVHLPDTARFKLRVRGGPISGNWVIAGDYPWVSSDVNAADIFTRDGATGYIRSETKGDTMKARKFTGSSLMYSSFLDYDVPLKCNVDVTAALKCVLPGAEDINTFGYCPGQWLTFVEPVWGGPGYCPLLDGDLVVVSV